MLSTDAHAGEVRSDELEAARLAVRSVPSFAFDRYGASGAQAPDVLLDALQRAWRGSHAEEGGLAAGTETPGCETPGCEDGSCAV